MMLGDVFCRLQVMVTWRFAADQSERMPLGVVN